MRIPGFAVTGEDFLMLAAAIKEVFLPTGDSADEGVPTTMMPSQGCPARDPEPKVRSEICQATDPHPEIPRSPARNPKPRIPSQSAQASKLKVQGQGF